jgi:hypothetical protein
LTTERLQNEGVLQKQFVDRQAPLGKSFQTPFGGSKVFLKGPCPGMEIPEISEISDISDLSDISEIF